MNWTHTPLALSALMFAMAAQATPNQATDAVAPEQATGFEHKSLVKAKNWMVTAANPLASEAGASILRQGGNAIDAMVTTQLMLGLVEPQSSGIGGGSFLVYWDAKKKALTTFDGRETAPLNATPELFLDSTGQPMKFYDAVVGGRSVGTPGTVKLLWETHRQYGKLEWARLIEPVAKLAEQGFEVSPRLAALIAEDKERLGRFPATKAYFFDAQGECRCDFGWLIPNLVLLFSLAAYHVCHATTHAAHYAIRRWHMRCGVYFGRWRDFMASKPRYSTNLRMAMIRLWPIMLCEISYKAVGQIRFLR